MTQPFLAGAVLYAKDVARLAAFYQSLTDWTLIEQHADHAVLQSDGVQLAIVAMAPQIAATLSLTSPPAIRERTPIKLCFCVASLDLARQQALRLGGALYGPEQEWSFQGQRVCDGFDPEGNVLQCRMPAPEHRASPHAG